MRHKRMPTADEYTKIDLYKNINHTVTITIRVKIIMAGGGYPNLKDIQEGEKVVCERVRFIQGTISDLLKPTPWSLPPNEEPIGRLAAMKGGS